MSDNRFQYFNPVAFFERYPNIEELFLKRNPFYEGTEDIYSVFEGVDDFPGLELLRQYYALPISTIPQSYGQYVTRQLIAEEHATLEDRTGDVGVEEQKNLDLFISLIEESIRKAEKHHIESNDPNKHMPGLLDPEILASWNTDKDNWKREAETIKRLKALKECPYTLHVILENGNDVFINEKPAFEKLFMDNEFPEIKEGLGQGRYFASRLFDSPSYENKEQADKDIYNIRDNDKSTFRNWRIHLKRNIVISEGVLRNIQDIYRDDFKDGEIQTTDPQLQDVFRKRRGDTDIVNVIETIQQNQMKIVTCPYEENVFVQGVAGSGKTVVLLQRLSDMVKRNMIEPSKSVFIEPNDEYNAFFEDDFRLRGLGEIKKTTMSSYLMSLVARYYVQFAETSFKERRAHGKSYPGKASPKEIMSEGYDKRLPKRTCIDKRGLSSLRKIMYDSPLTNIIKEVRSEHVYLKARFEPLTFIDYHDAKDTTDRFGRRMTFEQWEREVRFDDVSMEAFKKAQAKGYKHEYGYWAIENDGNDRFSKKNPYIDLEDFERLISEFLQKVKRAAKNDESIPSTFDNLEKEGVKIPTSLAYGIIRLLYEEYGPLKDYYQDFLICVDECQDYNYRVFDILNRVQPNMVFNLFGDIDQDIGYHGANWDKDQKIADQIEKHVNFRFTKFELLENYRNSDEIVDYCQKEFEINNKGYGVSTMPVYRIDSKRLIALLTFHESLKDRSVIIFDDKYETAVKDYLVPLFEKYGLRRVKLHSPVDVKGLEFDVVFIIGFTEMKKPERYVSCTRALSELYIVQTKAGGNE